MSNTYEIGNATRAVLQAISNEDQAGKERTHCLYVISLNWLVRHKPKFRKSNPSLEPGAFCVYVGKSVHDPEKRFRQHREGIHASRWVERYGESLLPQFFEEVNPISRRCADKYEPLLADALRADGYGVVQN
jgi:hypothetical protein